MSLLSEQPTAAGLAARLRDASEVTAELMTEFIGNACRRFPSVGQTKKTARIERLIGYGAWTDGRWRSPIWNCRGGSSRRITYKQGRMVLRAFAPARTAGLARSIRSKAAMQIGRCCRTQSEVVSVV